MWDRLRLEQQGAAGFNVQWSRSLEAVLAGDFSGNEGEEIAGMLGCKFEVQVIPSEAEPSGRVKKMSEGRKHEEDEEAGGRGMQEESTDEMVVEGLRDLVRQVLREREKGTKEENEMWRSIQDKVYMLSSLHKTDITNIQVQAILYMAQSSHSSQGPSTHNDHPPDRNEGSSIDQVIHPDPPGKG